MRKDSVVAKFIKSAVENRAIEIYGDGNQTRDFLFIDDLTDAVMKAARKNVAGELFQIATNRELTINEVADQIRKSIKNFSGLDFKIKYTNKRRGDVNRNFSDNSKARKLLGWQPRETFESGIGKTIRYFLNLYTI